MRQLSGATSVRAASLVAAVLSLALISGLFAAPSPATASSTHASGTSYYLSLGDSLAVGDQPGDSNGSATLHGYSNQVVTDLASTPLTLENFGCAGATTTSILSGVGCSGGEALNGVNYANESQANAAISFINAHPDQVKLITIDVGANDYAQCVVNLTPPSSCVNSTLSTMSTNITNLVSKLRQAAGPNVVILGMTDFVDALAYWINVPSGKTLAKDWIAEFRNTLIPTFTKAYSTSNAELVNIASDSGAYQPLTKLVKVKAYGKIPLAVERNCQLVWMCQTHNQDAHPTSAGYTLMAREVAQAYTKAVT